MNGKGKRTTNDIEAKRLCCEHGGGNTPLKETEKSCLQPPVPLEQGTLNEAAGTNWTCVQPENTVGNSIQTTYAAAFQKISKGQNSIVELA